MTSSDDVVKIIQAVGAVATVIIAAMANYHASKARTSSAKNTEKIEEVHQKVNGLTEARVEEAKKSGFIAGVLSEKEHAEKK